MRPKIESSPVEAGPSTESPSWSDRLLERLFRPRRLLIMAVMILAAAATPRFLRSLPDLSQREEYRIHTREIRIADRPSWVPHDLVDQVIRRAELPEELSLLDADLSPRLAEAFLKSPWVTGVRILKKVPARIEVELTFRRPAAMVQVEQGLYAIDGEGVLLPTGDFSAADIRQYPLVVNVGSRPRGPAGTVWK